MIADGENADTEYTIGWEPQPGPQTALLACPVFEAFFGGARGGGKTDGMLGEWPPMLVRAWLEGDWTVIEGAYFDCWRYDLHVVDPFEVPAHWARFRSMDWGSAKPFSVGWWAIVGDDHCLSIQGASRIIPRGPHSTLPTIRACLNADRWGDGTRCGHASSDRTGSP